MGSWGTFLGFQGERPWKEGQRVREDADSARGHLLLESLLLPSLCSFPSMLTSQAPSAPPVRTQFPGSLS